jgi:uncharacterized membrane protein
MTDNREIESTQGVPSTVSIRKHPLHPAIVDFPIAFLTAALVTDLLFWRTGQSHWSDFSFWLILAGWITGGLGVITGLIDFLTLKPVRALTSGWLHFLLADLAIFVTTFNLISRLYDRQDKIVFAGLGMSALVTLALFITGFLGGRLVFRHHIGVYGIGGMQEQLPSQDSSQEQ